MPRSSSRQLHARSLYVGVGALVVCWGSAVSAGETQPTGELGTLLFTPAQRSQINRARLPEPVVPAPPVSEAQRLNGIVQREGGRGTVWINGKPMLEGDTATPQIRGGHVEVNGRRLQVGETLETGNGAQRDVVAPGAVTVQRKP